MSLDDFYESELYYLKKHRSGEERICQLCKARIELKLGELSLDTLHTFHLKCLAEESLKFSPDKLPDCDSCRSVSAMIKNKLLEASRLYRDMNDLVHYMDNYRRGQYSLLYHSLGRLGEPKEWRFTFHKVLFCLVGGLLLFRLVTRTKNLE